MSEMQIIAVVNPVIDQNAFIQAGLKGGQLLSSSINKSFGRIQPLGRITGQVSEFEKSMEAANARVLAFGASAAGIYLVKSAIEKLVTSTITVEKNLADINAVLNIGTPALKAFSAEMFKAAGQTGQTFETASKVALEFARHGVSAAEAAKRMTAAMQLMRISGLDAQEAVNVMTAAINAFSREGLTASDVVNRLTAVDTKFAISAQDLAKAIERTGSVAEDAGVQFNQLLGLVTAAQTVTARGGAVIGNAFKSIFTRLSRPQVLDDLEYVGVATKNASGQILPMMTILKNLAGQYNNLNAGQRSFITEMVGGVYQVNILKAALADLGNGFSITDKAAIAASQSSNLIDKRMSALNETISSKLNVSTLEMTKLFSDLGNLSFGDRAKTGLDSFNDAVKNISFYLGAVDKDADSTGVQIGKTLSRGIAKGLGAIVSGPLLQVGTALAGGTLARLAKFAGGAGRSLVFDNAGLEKKKLLQQDITTFISREPKLLEAIMQGQVSVNDVTAIYLSQLRQAAQLQQTISGIAGRAATISYGSINISKSSRVPNFAADPIQDAYNRESAALAARGYSPEGKIYYSKESGLPNGGIFNTIDEPNAAARSAAISSRGIGANRVPNFALDASVMLGMAMSMASGASKPTPAAFGYDKQLSQTQEMYRLFDKIISELKSIPIGTKRSDQSVSFNGQKYGRAQLRAFEKDFTAYANSSGVLGAPTVFSSDNDPQKNPIAASQRAGHVAKYTKYEEDISKARERTQSRAFKASIALPIAGGLAASAMETYGAGSDKIEGVSKLFEGVGQASQALFAMPNAVGLAIGGFLALNKASDAVISFQSKLGVLSNAYDLEKTKLEKLSGTINAVQNSYEALGALYESGKGTTEEGINLTRKLAQSMAALIAVNPEVAEKLRSAATPEERGRIQAVAIDEQSERTQKAEFSRNYAKLKKDEQVVPFYDIYEKRGSRGHYTAKNAEEAPRMESELASAAIQVENEILNTLSKSNRQEDKDTLQRFAQNTPTTSDAAKILASLGGSTTFQGQSPKDQSAVSDKLKTILASISIPDDKLDAYIKANDELAAAKLFEINIRKRYNEELNNLLHKGSVVAQFENQNAGQLLQQRGRLAEGTFAQGEAGIRLKGLVSSGVDTLTANSSNRQNLIGAMADVEVAKVKTQRGSAIGEEISKTFGEYLKENVGAKTNKAGALGGEPTQARLRQSEYLAKRQLYFSGEEGAKRLAANAQNMTPEKFAEVLLGGKEGENALGKPGYADLSTRIATTMGSETQVKEQGGVLLEIQNILEKSNEERKKEAAEFQASLKEAQFKELAQSLGGLSLLAKGGQREMRRRIRKDEFLSEHGRTYQSRARGAADLLQLIPESQRDINNPYIGGLFGKVQSGFEAANARVLRGTSLGALGVFGAPGELSQAQTFGNIKAAGLTNEHLQNMGLKMPPIITSPLDEAVSKSAQALDRFSAALDKFGSQAPHIRMDKEWAEQNIANKQKELSGIYSAPAPNEKPNFDAGFAKDAGYLEAGKYAGGIAIAGAGAYLGKRVLQSQALKVFGAGLKGANNLAAVGAGQGSMGFVASKAFGAGRALRAAPGALARGATKYFAPTAAIIGGMAGYSQAEEEGLGGIAGATAGVLTGSAYKGSFLGRVGVVQRGGAADAALGYAGAATQGAAVGAGIGAFFGGIGAAPGAAIGGTIGVGVEALKNNNKDAHGNRIDSYGEATRKSKGLDQDLFLYQNEWGNAAKKQQLTQQIRALQNPNKRAASQSELEEAAELSRQYAEIINKERANSAAYPKSSKGTASAGTGGYAESQTAEKTSPTQNGSEKILASLEGINKNLAALFAEKTNSGGDKNLDVVDNLGGGATLSDVVSSINALISATNSANGKPATI